MHGNGAFWVRFDHSAGVRIGAVWELSDSFSTHSGECARKASQEH
jgi:hypothetical protein